MFSKAVGLVVGVALFATGTCMGEETTTVDWTGVAGDGKWSTDGNWKGGQQPGAGEVAVFPADWSGRVEVDADVAVNSVHVHSPDLHLAGNGRLESSFVIAKKAKLVIDGAECHDGGYTVNVQEGGVLELVSGSLTSDPVETGSHVIWIGDGAKFIVRGGRAALRRMSRYAGSELVLEGGVLSYESDNGDLQGAASGMTWTGGTLIQPADWSLSSNRGFKPAQASQTLVCRYTGDPAINWFASSPNGAVEEWGGTVYITNNASSAWANTSPNNIAIRGRGKLFVPNIYVEGSTIHTVTSDWAQVGLAKTFSVSKYSGSDGSGIYFRGTRFSAFGNWGNYGQYSHDGMIYLQGETVFETTDCFDGRTPRTVSLHWVCPQERAGLSFTGCGEVKFTPLTESGRMGALLSKLSIGDGTTFTWDRGSDANAVNWRTCDFTMGAGAVMNNMTAGLDTITAARSTLSPEATLNVAVPSSLTAGTSYPVVVSGYGSGSDVGVKLTGAADAWQVKRKFGCVYLADGSQPSAAYSYEWTGAADGKWSNSLNWNGGVPLNDTRSPYFGGDRCTALTNDVEGIMGVNCIEILPSCGPFAVCGNPLKFKSASIRSGASAINHRSPFPLTFACDVYGKEGTANLDVWNRSTAFVEFLGKLSVPNGLSLSGEVHIGGEASCTDLYLNYASPQTTLLHVLSGGRLDVAVQAKPFEDSSSIVIDKGGVLKVTSGTWRTTAGAHSAVVNGEMDLNVTMSSVTAQSFFGTGSVAVREIVADAGGSSVITIGEGVRFCPGKFATETTASAGKTVALAVESAATLGATTDWTYGAEGVATSSADSRALRVGTYGELTFDTQNPKTGAGQTITLDEKVLADGSVVKKGEGKLVFRKAGSAFNHGFAVAGGEIGVDGELADGTASGWTELFTVKGDPDAAITLTKDLRKKIVSKGADTFAVMAKNVVGMLLLIR